jgi:hypothetical protein
VQLSTVSILNTVQSYLTTSYTRRTYPYTPKASSPGPNAPAPPHQVTALQARTFGTWTFMASVVRFYCAYRLQDPDFYKLAMWTFAIALAHFGSEALVFGTTGLRTGAFSTFFIASGSLVWMTAVWQDYVL